MNVAPWLMFMFLSNPASMIAITTAFLNPRILYPRLLSSHRMVTDMTRISFTACLKCKGEGKLRRPLSKKARAKRAKMVEPIPPQPNMSPCTICSGTGIVEGTPPPPVGPNVAIIGGGLGGLALVSVYLHISKDAFVTHGRIQKHHLTHRLHTFHFAFIYCFFAGCRLSASLHSIYGL
jgi:hypothetical protein